MAGQHDATDSGALPDAGAWSRRALLRGSVLALGGLSAAALIGCGEDDDAPPNQAAATSAAGGTATQAGVIKDPNMPFPYQFPEPAGKTPKKGGVMHVGVDWEPAQHDVVTSAAGGTITAPNVAYNRLLGYKSGPRFDPYKLELEPELAANWERTPDGLTYTFKLKPNIKWHNVAPLNGRAFEAADVKFAYERYQKEGVHRQYFTSVKSFEAVDKQTLKITLNKALADFVAPLGGRYLTIFPKELVDDGSIAKTIVGTGPMILKERTPGQRIVFERNPDYFEGPVNLDGLEFRIILDRDAQLAAFRAEQLEFTYALSFAANKRDIDALVKTNPNVQLNMSATTFTTPFAMNLSSPKYQDARIRRAIQLSIDPAVVTNFYDNLATTLALQPWNLVFDKEPTVASGLFGKWWGFNIEESKKLLAAAGAEKLAMQNIYYPYSGYFDKIAEYLVDAFRNVGVTMTGGRADYTEFNSQWVGGKLADVSTGGWAAAGYDADNYFYAHLHSKSPANRWRLNDPKVDEWAEAQQIELDPQKRKDIFRKVWDYNLDQVFFPRIPAVIPTIVYQPWLRGVRFGGAFGASSSYYDWGEMLSTAWLDK